MGTTQRFCLRWNNHQSNLLSVFDQLLHDEAFVDVTLAVEGQFLRAHKMVLSACSPYFQSLFVGHPDRHPIVILKDVPYADMRSLLDFMYRGEVSVDQERLTAFLKVAETLRIKGLTEVNEERCPDLPAIASSLLSNSSAGGAPPPPPSLHRIHPLSHKRVLAPLAANPLLGSALTAPKRKRGRPRKLSGSSNGPNTGDDESNEHELRLHHPNRTDSPVMGPPDLLEVNMGGDSDHNPNHTDDDPIGIEPEDEDNKVDHSSEIEEVDEKPIKQEPTPGPSNQDSTFKTNHSKEEDHFSPGENVVTIKPDPEEREESFNPTFDMEECYDDMIACSPASSDFDQESVNSKNGKKGGGRRKEGLSETDELLDEDISQYEFDSFRSMMAGAVGAGTGTAGPQGKPMDKASVRRYCTHEADNAYRCNVCGKTYTHISNFCRHFLSTHHGMRPEIPCPVCFKLFTRKDNMMTHTKQVHRLTLHRGTLQPIVEPPPPSQPPPPYPETI